jgi:hypothetical protein
MPRRGQVRLTAGQLSWIILAMRKLLPFLALAAIGCDGGDVPSGSPDSGIVDPAEIKDCPVVRDPVTNAPMVWASTSIKGSSDGQCGDVVLPGSSEAWPCFLTCTTQDAGEPVGVAVGCYALAYPRPVDYAYFGRALCFDSRESCERVCVK